MSNDETSAPPAAESETETETETTTDASGGGKTPRVGLHSLLTRDTDMAARPGFRNPSNKRSKAQTKSKAKKKVGRNKKKRR